MLVKYPVIFLNVHARSTHSTQILSNTMAHFVTFSSGCSERNANTFLYPLRIWVESLKLDDGISENLKYKNLFVSKKFNVCTAIARVFLHYI